MGKVVLPPVAGDSRNVKTVIRQKIRDFYFKNQHLPDLFISEAML
jgi:hypothetical protein